MKYTNTNNKLNIQKNNTLNVYHYTKHNFDF